MVEKKGKRKTLDFKRNTGDIKTKRRLFQNYFVHWFPLCLWQVTAELEELKKKYEQLKTEASV